MIHAIDGSGESLRVTSVTITAAVTNPFRTLLPLATNIIQDDTVLVSALTVVDEDHQFFFL